MIFLPLLPEYWNIGGGPPCLALNLYFSILTLELIWKGLQIIQASICLKLLDFLDQLGRIDFCEEDIF
jgi:hypothetical protein